MRTSTLSGERKSPTIIKPGQIVFRIWCKTFKHYLVMRKALSKIIPTICTAHSIREVCSTFTRRFQPGIVKILLYHSVSTHKPYMIEFAQIKYFWLEQCWSRGVLEWFYVWYWVSNYHRNVSVMCSTAFIEKNNYRWTDSGSRNVPFPFPCDGSQSTKRSSSKRSSTAPENAVDELIQNEQKYIDSLMNGILNFIPLIYHMNLPGGLRGQRNNLFGNVEEIHELHQDDFLPALRRCYQNVEKIAQCFIHYVETEKFYCYVKYALNRRKSDTIFERHRDYFSVTQLFLSNCMPSYNGV